MRSGTTTVNMISSTSTTSTSGVMLISDCSLEPDSLLLNCMMSLSFCVGALSDQPYATEAGLLDRDHRLPDLAEIELYIAPEDDLGVWLGTHHRAESFVEMLDRDGLIVDPQPTSRVYRDQDSASLIALRVRFRRVRQVDVGPLSHLRGHHHEDDQQHQHHVDERRDVDGCLHRSRLTESHRPALPSSPSLPSTGLLQPLRCQAP